MEWDLENLFFWWKTHESFFRVPKQTSKSEAQSPKRQFRIILIVDFDFSFSGTPSNKFIRETENHENIQPYNPDIFSETVSVYTNRFGPREYWDGCSQT